jgi:hypothetical protein
MTISAVENGIAALLSDEAVTPRLNGGDVSQACRMRTSISQ